MKIILAFPRLPEEVVSRFGHHPSRTDKDLIALIEKRVNDREGSRKELQKLYFPNVNIDGSSEIGSRVSKALAYDIKCEIDKELDEYKRFVIDEIPDDATYATLFYDAEGMSYPVYMRNGVLYCADDELENLLEEVKNDA